MDPQVEAGILRKIAEAFDRLRRPFDDMASATGEIVDSLREAGGKPKSGPAAALAEKLSGPFERLQHALREAAGEFRGPR